MKPANLTGETGSVKAAGLAGDPALVVVAGAVVVAAFLALEPHPTATAAITNKSDPQTSERPTIVSSFRG